MKVVLFCGGEGMRIRDYSDVPKPMVTVGNRPILWHVMRYYAHFGYKDFILCLGYGAEAIKRFFLDYEEAVSNDFVMKKGGSERIMLGTDIDDWSITFVDTGFRSEIGERLRRIEPHLDGDEMFLANYADGVTDLDLSEYVTTFQSMEKVAGFLAVRPPQSYHVAQVEGSEAVSMGPISEEDLWLNGGYFIFRKEIFDYINPGEDLVAEPFARIIGERKLYAHKFEGFWSPMDTFKEQTYLEGLYTSVAAPWALWRNGNDG
jgi:glucose-1-phosphate cytidylyltransferase